MRNLKLWQRSGLAAAAGIVLLEAVLGVVSRASWWYQETIWYRCLMVINYPAAKLHQLLLHWLVIPRIYDVPLKWDEALVIYLTGFGLSAIWWFFLGAAVSVVWSWLSRRFSMKRKDSASRIQTGEGNSTNGNKTQST